MRWRSAYWHHVTSFAWSVGDRCEYHIPSSPKVCGANTAPVDSTSLHLTVAVIAVTSSPYRIFEYTPQYLSLHTDRHKHIGIQTREYTYSHMHIFTYHTYSYISAHPNIILRIQYIKHEKMHQDKRCCTHCDCNGHQLPLIY